jgi:hypothetical protein
VPNYQGVDWPRLDEGPDLAEKLFRADSSRVEPREVDGEFVLDVVAVNPNQRDAAPVARARLRKDEVVISEPGHERTAVLSIRRAASYRCEVFTAHGEKLGSIVKSPLSKRAFELFDWRRRSVGIFCEPTRDWLFRTGPFFLVSIVTLGLSQTTAADRFVPRLRVFAGRHAAGELICDGNFAGSLTLAGDPGRRIDRALAISALVALVAWPS